MKIIITEDQYGQLTEMIKLDINVGDTIMGGKFKNKKVVVKTIGKNDKGDITINGKPLLRFRIIKENIMTESRSKILWLRRRFNDSETMDLLKDIVIEGFDYVNPCDYETYPGYETNIINGSIPTFINSYTELSGDVYVEDNELDEFIRKVIIGKFRGLILREYRDRYCEEDEDDDEDIMITETKDNQIRSFLRRLSIADKIISELNPKDVCRIWNDTKNDALYFADDVIVGIVYEINETLGIKNSYNNKDLYKFFEDFGYYDKLIKFFHESFELCK